MKDFLNSGISRKQYFFLFFLGILLTPLWSAASIYILYLIFGPEQLGQNSMLSLLGLGILFVPVGLYFYILKIKRLHDMGSTNDAFGSYLIPYGDLFLNVLLFGKKSKIQPKDKKKKITVAKYFQSTPQKVAVFLIFVALNWLWLTRMGTDFTLYNPLIISEQYKEDKIKLFFDLLGFVTQFLFLPYLYSYFFRVVINKVRNK